MRDDGPRPRYSRCSAGKGRWFWVGWVDHRYSFEEDVDRPATAWGYEATAEAAEARARDAAGPGAEQLNARDAEWYKRRLTVEARMACPAKGSTDSARLEFLYRVGLWYDDYDGSRHVSVEKHRIVRKTTRRIYIEKDPFHEDRWERMRAAGREPHWYDHDVRTLVVDRVKLERDGSFSHGSGGWWAGSFYATEEDGRRALARHSSSRAPHWCEPLGLDWPCSIDDVKAAYRRLAKESHPDRGGDPEAFVAIERAYRAALAGVGRAAAVS